MPPESWLVVTVAAAFLLLGVAGSPLAWVALHQRRARSERHLEQWLRELAREVRGLENRLAQFESLKTDDANGRGCARADSSGWRIPAAPRMVPVEPTLIAVPNLEAAQSDRDGTASGLKERYRALWALADSGAAPEVIARATGQPIGQIELILGLRRQIDGTQTTISHGPHGKETLKRP